MKKPNYRRLNIYDTIGIIILSVIALLAFSFSTSPFYHTFGYDSLEYKLAGAAILDGGVIFRDIFHQKGALFVFVEAIGELLCRLFGNENIGTFIIQWFNMSVTLCLMLDISKKYVYNYDRISLKRLGAVPYIVSGGVFLFWIALLSFGNQVEEFSVLYDCIMVYLSVDYCLRLQEWKTEFRSGYGFVAGVCLAVTMWFKPTTSVVIIGCIIFIGIELLINKQISCIFKNIGTGLLGIAAVTVPLFIYYYVNGALGDMLEQCFTFNIWYSNVNKDIVNTFQKKLLTLVGVVAFPAVSFVIAVLNRFRPVCLLSFLMCAANAAMFYVTSVSYLFYAMPMIVCLLVVVLSTLDLKLPHGLIYTVLCGVLALSVLFCFVDKRSKIISAYPWYRDVQVQSERYDDFYSKVKPYFDNDNDGNFNSLVLTETYFENRYIYYHTREYPFDSMFAVDFFNKIMAEDYIERFVTAINSKPPKHIVISKELCADSRDFCDTYYILFDKIKTDYEMVYTDGNYSLYELK